MNMTDEKNTEIRSAEHAVVDRVVDAGLLDELMSRVDAGEVQLTGEGGFLPEMIKAVLERGLVLADRLVEHGGDGLCGDGIGAR